MVDKVITPGLLKARLEAAKNSLTVGTLKAPRLVACFNSLLEADDSGWAEGTDQGSAQARANAHRSITAAVAMVQAAENHVKSDHLYGSALSYLLADADAEGTVTITDSVENKIKEGGFSIPAYNEHTRLALKTAKQLVARQTAIDSGTLTTANEAEKKFLSQAIVSLYKNKAFPKEMTVSPTQITFDANFLGKTDHKEIVAVSVAHQETQDTLATEQFERLQRTFKLTMDHPSRLLAWYSVPFISSLYFRTKGLDRDLYYLISSLYSISGYSKETQNGLQGLYNQFFGQLSPLTDKQVALDAFCDYLVGNKDNGLFFKMQKEGLPFFRKSGKDGAAFLRSFKLAINRITRRCGGMVFLQGETDTYYDAQGERQEETRYIAIRKDRSLEKYNHAWWKGGLFVLALIAASIVGPGQGVIAANGFYSSVALIGQMTAGIPIVGSALSAFFIFLSVHPVALFSAVLLVLFSSSFTNFYLFGEDARTTLVSIVARRDLFKGFTRLQKALGYFSFIPALGMGLTIGGLTLFSMLTLATPLAASTFVPLGLLQIISVGTAAFTVLNVSLVMISALVSKIRGEAHIAAARYVLNLFLPIVHLFKLNAKNSKKVEQFIDAAHWDEDKGLPANKWNVHNKSTMLTVAIAHLIATRAQRIKQRLGLTVELADTAEFNGLIKTLKGLDAKTFFNDTVPEAAKADLSKLGNTLGLTGDDADQHAWNALREQFTHGPLLGKTQRQQYEWTQKHSNLSITNRMLLGLTQVLKMAFFAVGLTVAALACLAIAIAWRQAAVSALTYFNIAQTIAEQMAFVTVYCVTGPVIAMFFGANIIKLFNNMTAGTTTQGFFYNNSAKDEALDESTDKHLTKAPKASVAYYTIHVISYAVTGLFMAALFFNFVGNALVSLISGEQFQHKLWSLHVHASTIQAGCIAFLTASAASLGVNVFPMREFMEKSSPHLTLNIRSWFNFNGGTFSGNSPYSSIEAPLELEEKVEHNLFDDLGVILQIDGKSLFTEDEQAISPLPEATFEGSDKSRFTPPEAAVGG